MRSTRPRPPAERSERGVPSEAELLQALRVLRAWWLNAPIAQTVYDQDHRPDGAGSRDRFLRLHREKVDAGIEGWSVAGKRRSVTSDAWNAYLAEQTETERERSSKRRDQRKAAAELSSDDVSAAMDRELGIITTKTANGGGK